MLKTVGFISLGCAKNRVNSEQMMFLLDRAGYRVSGDVDHADAVVINTCGFIDEAKREAIDTILEIAENKKAGTVKSIIAAGCLPQRYKDEFASQFPEVDAVIGTGSFDDIVQVVGAVVDDIGSSCSSNGISRQLIKFGDIDSTLSEASRIITTSPNWAYLKIADGCDNRCAYCTIPAIRGRYRSRPTESIIKEAEKLAGNGFCELVLVAQDTTSYGYDLYGQRMLAPLLRALEEIEELKWIRLLYMYPDAVNNDIIDEISNSGKIVKYLDIPIQHISDNILCSMNRRGSKADIYKLLETLRQRIDGIVLRTSIITGLPGEGEDEFKELCRFLEQMEIERAGVFTYSPQEGTPASKMSRPSEDTAARRAEIVRGIQAQIMDKFNKSRLGTIQTVLFEGTEGKDEAALSARSYAEAPEIDGYIKINNTETSKAKNTQAMKFAQVRITSVEEGELTGEVVT